MRPASVHYCFGAQLKRQKEQKENKKICYGCEKTLCTSDLRHIIGVIGLLSLSSKSRDDLANPGSRFSLGECWQSTRVGAQMHGAGLEKRFAPRKVDILERFEVPQAGDRAVSLNE